MDNENKENIEVSEEENKDKKFGEVSEQAIEAAKEAEPEDIKEKPPVDIKNELLEWAESFVFAMFVVIFVFTFFLRVVLVDGASMNDTLVDKDRLVLTHLNYTPKDGDIVIINSDVLQKTIIKRVIGTEGDTVVVNYNDNSVTVNGEKIKDEHKKNEFMLEKGYFDISYRVSDGVYQYEVPKDKVFVMGDNRNNSRDSREIGFIDEDDVLGKAVFRLYPMDNFGKVD